MEETAVPDLYQLAFMPGCFRCPKCAFVLTKSCINANSGAIGTREQERQSEPCPNDGTMMVHVTYREQLEVYAERLKEEFERYGRLKRAVDSIPAALMLAGGPPYNLKFTEAALREILESQK